MSASDNLSKSLFHGSSHPFNKGDIITPKGKGHAFATINLEYAKYHLEEIKGKEGKVYTVEPVDRQEMEEETSKGEFGNYRLSKKGFRVTGEA